MEVTAEMKEELLNDSDAMQILSSMVDYRKGLLLELIQNNEIIPHRLKEARQNREWISDPAVQEQMDNLPPGGDLEVRNLLMTGIDPDTPLSEWTASEAKIANTWWTKEFPEESNPLGLDEDYLPETLEEDDDDDSGW